MASELLEQYQQLLKKSQRIAELLCESTTPIGIIVEKTIDNLCAGSILLSGLWAKEYSSHIHLIDPPIDVVDIINETPYTHYCLVGAFKNKIDDITQLTNKHFIIIDYHLSKEEAEEIENKGIILLSAKTIGIPENFISNAGLAYLITKSWLDDYQQFASLALLGAMNEKQFDNLSGEFVGLNKKIVEEAKTSNIIDVTKTNRLLGRESVPIHLALKYSTNPVLVGLTGNEKACSNFLSRIGISMKDRENNWRTISDLTTEETKKLNDNLVSLLSEETEISSEDIRKLIGNVYVVLNEAKHSPLRNLEEFHWVLCNAIRLKLYGPIVSVLLGDRKEEYQLLINSIKEKPEMEIRFIDRLVSKDANIIKETKYYRLIDATELENINLAKLLVLSLIRGESIDNDRPSIVFVKKRKYIYAFVYESKYNIERGYLIYHPLVQAHKNGIVEKIVGSPTNFEIQVIKENFDELLTLITNSLEYHYSGKLLETDSDTKNGDGITVSHKNELNASKSKDNQKSIHSGSQNEKVNNHVEKEKTSHNNTKRQKKNSKKINLFEFIESANDDK